MPYTITTKDGITLRNIPDDVDPNSQELKDRVASIRAGNQGGGTPPVTPQMLPSHAVAPEMAPSHVPGAPLPESVTQIPEPQTTVQGVTGGIVRGLAPYAAGSAGGPPGVAAVAAAKMVGDPLTAGFNQLMSSIGLEPLAHQVSPSQAMDMILDKMGISKPQTATERVVQAGAETAGSGLGMAKLGEVAMRQGSRWIAGAGKMLAANQPQQIVGSATAGVASQTAQEMGAGPGGQLLSGLAGGVLGAGLAAPRGVIPSGGIAPSIAEAEKAGINVMTSDVRKPQTFASKWIQSMGEKIPIAGTGGPRQAQQAQRVEAIKNLAAEYGVSNVAEVSDDVARDLLDKRSADLTKYSNLKNGVIDKLSRPIFEDAGSQIKPVSSGEAQTWKAYVGSRMSDAMKTEGSHGAAMKKIGAEWKTKKVGVPAPSSATDTYAVVVTNTTKAIDKQIGELTSLNTKDAVPIIDRLTDWKTAIQGQDLKNVDKLRAQIGESFKDPSLAASRSLGEKSLSSIYGPLKEDMGNFIKANGDRTDYTKWRVANARLSESMNELNKDVLKNVLDKGKETPEVVQRMLFSSKPSDVKALMAGLTAQGKGRAKVAILGKVIEDAGGIENVSPEKFITSARKMGSPIGVAFDGQEAQRLNGLVRALKLTEHASKAALATPTGVQAVPIIGTAVLTDLMGGAGAALATGATLGGLARVYESVPIRNLLMKLPSMKPGSPEEAALFKRLTVAIQQANNEQEKK